MDKREAVRARAGYKAARKGLCKFGAQGLLNSHQIIPAAMGGLDITVGVPGAQHQQLHNILHYLFKFLDL
jgi:hypothetical protein